MNGEEIKRGGFERGRNRETSNNKIQEETILIRHVMRAGGSEY